MKIRNRTGVWPYQTSMATLVLRPLCRLHVLILLPVFQNLIVNLQVQDGELPQDRGYMCKECCRVEGRPYPWPPYRPPDIEAELAESVELAGHDEGRPHATGACAGARKTLRSGKPDLFCLADPSTALPPLCVYSGRRRRGS